MSWDCLAWRREDLGEYDSCLLASEGLSHRRVRFDLLGPKAGSYREAGFRGMSGKHLNN